MWTRNSWWNISLPVLLMWTLPNNLTLFPKYSNMLRFIYCFFWVLTWFFLFDCLYCGGKSRNSSFSLSLLAVYFGVPLTASSSATSWLLLFYPNLIDLFGLLPLLTDYSSYSSYCLFLLLFLLFLVRTLLTEYSSYCLCIPNLNDIFGCVYWEKIWKLFFLPPLAGYNGIPGGGLHLTLVTSNPRREARRDYAPDTRYVFPFAPALLTRICSKFPLCVFLLPTSRVSVKNLAEFHVSNKLPRDVNPKSRSETLIKLRKRLGESSWNSKRHKGSETFYEIADVLEAPEEGDEEPWKSWSRLW